jgi:hypothetical protein
VIEESDLQEEKHFQQRIWTFRGVKIDLSDDDGNTFDSIICKRILYSNAIDETNFHFLKKNDSKIFKFSGIQIR